MGRWILFQYKEEFLGFKSPSDGMSGFRRQQTPFTGSGCTSICKSIVNFWLMASLDDQRSSQTQILREALEMYMHCQ